MASVSLGTTEGTQVLDALNRRITEPVEQTLILVHSIGETGLAASRSSRAILLGMSPMDALWEYRLVQAARWLSETSITVSEVAYGVGFKSVPHVVDATARLTLPPLL